MRWRNKQRASATINALAHCSMRQISDQRASAIRRVRELRQRSRGGRWVRQRTVRVRQRTVEDDLVDSWHGHLEVRPRTCMVRWRHGRGVRQRIVACAGAPPLARLIPVSVEDHRATPGLAVTHVRTAYAAPLRRARRQAAP